MKFCRKINKTVEPGHLEEVLTVNNLPKYCNSISTATETAHNTGTIYCTWGEFVLHREKTDLGLRFTLQDCPNGFYWEINTENYKDDNQIILLGEVIKSSPEPELVESVEEFFNDWVMGLEDI